MKKRILLLVFALAATTLHAQMEDDPYALWCSDEGDYMIGIDNMMQQRDGDILIVTDVLMEYSNHYARFLGNIFYKVSPYTHTLTDSLFVADSLAPYYFFARNPQGEGNLRTNIEYDEERDTTYLRISHFTDNSFVINHDDDNVVPLCEGQANDYLARYMLDSRGDIVMKYYKVGESGSYDCHMARFGVDGTFKHEAILPASQNYIEKMFEFDDNSNRFYQWKGYTDESLAFFVIDSAFQLQTFSVISQIISIDTLPYETEEPYWFAYEHFEFNTDTEVIPVGGNDVLVAARYSNDTNFDPITAESGVAVAKYDLLTLERKGLIVFNDYPGYTSGYCMGFKKTSDGSVYFLYREDTYGDTSEGFVIVKMDSDLNVEWKRFFKTDNIKVYWPLQCPILYEDEQGEEKGIVWGGQGVGTIDNKSKLVNFFLDNTGTESINGSGIEVRPFAFYPNPVQGLLRFDFSPDVQPALVELFDLQGRLVLSQQESFGCIDTGRLASGTYVMRVALKDGRTFSDKVVKE